MKVVKFTNKILSSNSYIIYSDEERWVWVIDPGDSGQIIEWINSNHKELKGILLTHSHIDHIYGINDLAEQFPAIKIFASEPSQVGLYSSKANGSYYMEMPYEVKNKNVIVVQHDSGVELFTNVKASVIYTPGHNNDCISFEISKYLFTGDALIPGVKVHTKSKHGDKLMADESINKIFNQFDGDTIICPGHGDMTLLGEINIDDIVRQTI